MLGGPKVLWWYLSIMTTSYTTGWQHHLECYVVHKRVPQDGTLLDFIFTCTRQHRTTTKIIQTSCRRHRFLIIVVSLTDHFHYMNLYVLPTTILQYRPKMGLFLNTLLRNHLVPNTVLTTSQRRPIFVVSDSDLNYVL